MSMSFLGLMVRCQYWQPSPMGVGMTMPAVYTACHTSFWCTRRVISLISTGASRLLRSRLCTQRKLISVMATASPPTRTRPGIPEMKATIFRFALTRIPTCHSCTGGGARARPSVVIARRPPRPRPGGASPCGSPAAGAPSRGRRPSS